VTLLGGGLLTAYVTIRGWTLIKRLAGAGF